MDKILSRLAEKAELILIACGALAFIISFLPWYSVSFSGPAAAYAGGSLSGWSVNMVWFPTLLLVALGGLMLAINRGVKLPDLPVGLPIIALGVSGLATLAILLRWVTLPGGSEYGVIGYSAGAGFGLYLGLIVALVATATSFATFKAAAPNPGAAPHQA